MVVVHCKTWKLLCFIIAFYEHEIILAQPAPACSWGWLFFSPCDFLISYYTHCVDFIM